MRRRVQAARTFSQGSMRSILAVSDLTPASDAALSAAAGLAVRTGAELHVVHSLEIVGMPLWQALQADVGRRIHDAESALAEQLRRAIPEGCAAGSRVLDFHNLQDSVLLRAREVGAELIVFGAADPRTPEGARHLGALQCVSEVAAVPCLLVREPFEPPLTRVLLPLSAAEVGHGVLADACEWMASLEGPTPAGRRRTELQVLHVTSGLEEWRDLAPEFDRELRWARDQPQWSAWLRIRRSIRWGVATYMEIIRVAGGADPHLVLLGPGCGVANSAAYLKDARAILLRRLPCSVLVLPGTLPRAYGDEAGAPAASADPQTPALEAPEPAARMELAASGD